MDERLANAPSFGDDDSEGEGGTSEEDEVAKGGEGEGEGEGGGERGAHAATVEVACDGAVEAAKDDDEREWYAIPSLPSSPLRTTYVAAFNYCVPNRYALGIIDILQQYNMRKKMEHSIKVSRACRLYIFNL